MALSDGFVTLVGAGPGDPGLLTLAGRQALVTAEVVLYDRLAGPEILAMIPAGALRIDVGKNKGNHPVPQEEINQTLVEHALGGKRVVRLKGGDPYLFGRGAEEAEALREHGIPFRVVPGVTSALAVPAYAGIPVTHREFASSVHILAGHGRDGRPPDIDYRRLAGLKGTLIFLMGLSALDDICDGLLAAGLSADTPAAVIGNGTLPGQRRIATTLADLPRLAKDDNLPAPAMVVVGAVCGLAEHFNWTEYLPLWGRRILTACSRTTGGRLAARLREVGCGVDEFAGIHMEPIEQDGAFWEGAGRYGWIAFTSQFGAELFFAGLAKRGIDVRRLAGVKFAVIGSRTADVLAERGVFADFIPADYNARGLALGLVERVTKDESLLLFRARDGNRDLTTILSEKGMAYDEIAAYDTAMLKPEGADMALALESGAYDAVAFTSASSVKSFAAAVTGIDRLRITAVCIGESTSAAAAGFGMKTLISRQATIDSMVERIIEEMGN